MTVYKDFRKADLHVHLNGAMPVTTFMNLFGKSDYRKYNPAYVIQTPVKNLIEYFKPWAYMRGLISSKERFFFMVEGIAKSLSDENISYVELRNSIIYLAQLNSISYEEVLDWFVESFVIFGEKYGIDMRLIISVRREYNQMEEYFKILKIVHET